MTKLNRNASFCRHQSDPRKYNCTTAVSKQLSPIHSLSSIRSFPPMQCLSAIQALSAERLTSCPSPLSTNQFPPTNQLPPTNQFPPTNQLPVDEREHLHLLLQQLCRDLLVETGNAPLCECTRKPSPADLQTALGQCNGEWSRGLGQENVSDLLKCLPQQNADFTPRPPQVSSKTVAVLDTPLLYLDYTFAMLLLYFCYIFAMLLLLDTMKLEFLASKWVSVMDILIYSYFAVRISEMPQQSSKNRYG